MNQARKYNFWHFSISKRIFKSTVKSKSWIILTALVVVGFLISVIFLGFINVNSAGNGRFIVVMVPLIIMFVYVAFFNIFNIWKYFSNETKNGLMSLEIRNGVSKSRLFWERMLPNKVFSIGISLICIFLFWFFHAVSPNDYAKLYAAKYTPALFFILIFDLAITAILLLFILMKNNVLMGIVGFGVLIIFAMAPLFQMLGSLTNPVDIENANKRNYQLLVAKNVNEIEAKYGSKSLIKEIYEDLSDVANNKYSFKATSIDDLNLNLDDERFDDSRIYLFNWERNVSWTDNNSYYSSYEEFEKNYFYDLADSGLLSEIENLPVYRKYYDQSAKEQKTVTFEVSLPGFEKTKTSELMSNMKTKINFDGVKNPHVYNVKDWAEIKKSIFYKDNNYPRDWALKGKLTGDYNYFDAYSKVNDGLNDESKELLKLTDDIIRANFLHSDNSVFRKIANDGAYNSWRGDKFDFIKSYNTDSNTWSWAKHLNNISPGQRTIQKVIFKMLEMTNYIEEPGYISNQGSSNTQHYYSGEEFKNQIAKSYLNPFNTFWKQINYLNGNNIYDFALNTSVAGEFQSSSLISAVYEVEGFNPNKYTKPDIDQADWNNFVPKWGASKEDVVEHLKQQENFENITIDDIMVSSNSNGDEKCLTIIATGVNFVGHKKLIITDEPKLLEQNNSAFKVSDYDVIHPDNFLKKWTNLNTKKIINRLN